MTTIYFIRHSIAQKANNIDNNDSLQIINEKQILSIEGEKLASLKLNIEELKNIDFLISSNYVRNIATAKYISFNNNIDINIIESFGERKFGVDSWDEIPNDFYEKQFLNPNYKLNNGESQLEVRNRMLSSLNKILNQFKDKRIAIVTHSTALLFLLMNWCDITPEKGIYYNNKFISSYQIENCAIFKLIFDNDKLIDIMKI